MAFHRKLSGLWGKGDIIRREEKSIHSRGDMSDYGDQRAIGQRKREGGRGGVKTVTAVKELEVSKKEGKEKGEQGNGSLQNTHTSHKTNFLV